MLHTVMKRIFYVSRCAPSLGAEDLRKIQQTSERNNPQEEITGFLIRLSDFFFQALEGPEESVDRLFRSKIQKDSRHAEILTLRTETNVTSRQFPQWQMKVFDLSSDQRELPTAFRYLMEALTDSHLTLARYTQPSVVDLLQEGIDPTQLSPRKQTVAVLFSDIIGFSILGNTVNHASRLESMTRQLGVRLVASSAVVEHARDTWPFVSLGTHPLKGLGDAGPLFGIADLPPPRSGGCLRLDPHRHIPDATLISPRIL